MCPRRYPPLTKVRPAPALMAAALLPMSGRLGRTQPAAAGRGSRLREGFLQAGGDVIGWEFGKLTDLHTAAMSQRWALVRQHDGVLEIGCIDHRVATELCRVSDGAELRALEDGLSGVDDVVGDLLEVLLPGGHGLGVGAGHVSGGLVVGEDEPGHGGSLWSGSAGCRRHQVPTPTGPPTGRSGRLPQEPAADRPVCALAGVGTSSPPRKDRTWEGGCVTTELIARARSGDGEAFRELTDRYRRELHVHCYRMLGSFQDAEDALQDALLAAWQGLGGFTEERASLRTWLYKITTNRCLNARRAARRRPAREWDMRSEEHTS